MSLGVLNNITAMYAANNLNNTSNSLSNVLQQLSSGSKINSGADDAAGLSLVNGLQANSVALAQSQTNASEGVGLLKVADGALSQVTNLLNRAVTLATEASNGTLNASQDTAANQEYQSILSEISNIGSTTTYNGNAVFNSLTNIFTGDSTTQGASITSLNIRSLSSSNVGDSGGVMSYSNGQNNVFLNLSTSSANAAVTDSLNSSGTTSIDVKYLVHGANGASTTASASISVGGSSGYENTVKGLINALNDSGLGLTASFTTQQQAGVQGGGTQTGIQISGGLISAGVDPSAGSTSGFLNASGIPAGQLLTQGQTISVAQGGSTVGTVTINSSINTLDEVARAINNGTGTGVTGFSGANAGKVTASVITNGDGTQSLSLSNSGAADGALTVSTTAGTNAAPVFAATQAGSATTDVRTNSGAVAGIATVDAVKSSLTIGAVQTDPTATGNPADPGDTVLSAGGSITLQNTTSSGTQSLTFVVGAGTDTADTFYTANAGDNSNTLSNLMATINTQSATLDATATIGANGGLVVTADTALASETVSQTSNTLSTATNTLGLYNPSLDTLGTYATAQLQLNPGDPLSSINDAADKLTGSFTLTNNGVSTTYVIGGDSADNTADTFYTGTASITGDALATFINANQNTGMNLVASAADGGTGAIYLQSSAVMGAGDTGISLTGSTLADSQAMSTPAGSSVAGVTAVAGNNASVVVGPASGSLNTSDAMTGSITITNGSGAGSADIFIVGSGSNSAVAGTFYTNNTDAGGTNYGNTLSGLAAAVNAYSTNHVTALASTNGLLLSQDGTSGDYSGATLATSSNTLSDVTKGEYSTATLSGFGSASDTVSGTLKFTVGSGAGADKSLTLTAGSTVSSMVDQINQAGLGVTASLVAGSNGSASVLLTSNTIGTDGTIQPDHAGISTIADTTTTADLSYSATGAYNVGISGSIQDQSTGQAAATYASNAKAGSGVATISYTDAAGVNLSNTDLSNQTDAKAALTALNQAITAVAAQDGYIGAMINTLNSVSSVLSTQQQNVVAAQNAVQATDYATAASNMSKYEILSQTGISALAQANSMQQEVTKLLQ